MLVALPDETVGLLCFSYKTLFLSYALNVAKLVLIGFTYELSINNSGPLSG